MSKLRAFFQKEEQEKYNATENARIRRIAARERERYLEELAGRPEDDLETEERDEFSLDASGEVPLDKIFR